jgi:hypothetical protein
MADSGEDFEFKIAHAGLLAALLQRVGYAFWQLCECEDTAAHYLVIRVKASRGIGAERGEALLSNAQRRTFGSLLHELKEAGVLEARLERRLLALLEERNWLAHRAKRESRGIIYRDQDFDRLVSRLDGIAEEATSLNTLLGRALEEFVVSLGIDPAFIEREAKRLAESWGYT